MLVKDNVKDIGNRNIYKVSEPNNQLTILEVIMSIGSKEVEQLITKVETACDNALGAVDIMDVLTNYGYSTEILTGVKTSILTELKDAATSKNKEYNDQYLATDAVTQLRKQFNTTYTKHVALLKIALIDDPVRLKTLAAAGCRLKSFSDWLEQAEMFYDGLVNDTLAQSELIKLNTTIEEITGMKTKLTELKKAKMNQSKEKGEAQRATELRDKKFDNMESWYTRFEGIARIAFADTPQKLEILGIFVRN